MISIARAQGAQTALTLSRFAGEFEAKTFGQMPGGTRVVRIGMGKYWVEWPARWAPATTEEIA